MPFSVKFLKLAVAALSFSLTAVFAEAEEKVRWLYNYEQALEEARQTGKPIFLEFRCAP